MVEVLHNGRRKPRPWTAQEQTTLEVAAACGVPIKAIAALLDRDQRLLRSHIGPSSRPERRQAMIEYSKAYREANKEQRDAQIKAWQAANRERVLANNMKWRQANRERHLELIKSWRSANPDRFNDVTRRRRQRLKIGKDFVQVTHEQRQQRFAIWQDCCAYCGVPASNSRNIGRRQLSVDHVLAIKHGGLDEPTNIVPACQTCNCSKNAKPVETWHRSQPFFTEARWRKIQRHCPSAVIGQLSIGA
jgi:hypothetical protein